jgi:hypothetical protein
MANIIGQQVSKAAGGGSGSESVEIPRMSVGASGTVSIAQLVRPGDTAVTVTKTDRDTVALTGGSPGLKVLLVSHSANPIGNPA